ncbi:MAG TPA: hypothetical protein ACFCUD_05365 [Cyclobacteriaceae bacterium]
MRFLLIWLFTILSCCYQLLAQEVKVKGGFIEDSLKIGKPVHFYLTAWYPLSMELVFPDSTHRFRPFEYFDKEFAPTKSDGYIAYDSVVYELLSFEVDPVQEYSLPVFILRNGDSSEIYSNKDSIHFESLAGLVTDTTALKSNVNYYNIALDFNYLYWGGGIIIGIVLLTILYMVFGKRIRKKIRLMKLKKDYKKFSFILENHINDLKIDPSPKRTEVAISDWRKYLEKLEKYPYTKLTTKEILMNNGFSDDIKHALKTIDRSIYGGYAEHEIHRNFEAIEDFTFNRYQKKIKEVIDE